MTASATIEIFIDKNQELLIKWNDRFNTHTLSQMLMLIKSENINPDEGFIIGYMTGVTAGKTVEDNTKIQKILKP